LTLTYILHRFEIVSRLVYKADLPLNVTVFSPAETPNILPAENGFVLSKMSIVAVKN
jgi:hypothetical protein